MSDNTKHLAKKCRQGHRGAVPRVVPCRRSGRAAGCSGAIRRAPKCQFSARLAWALAGAMMTGGVLDLVFWVLDPFGWKNEG